MKPKKEGICDKCGKELIQRPDDRAETIENRLAVYQRDTAPLIEYYEKKGLLKRIQGDSQYQEVLDRIFGVLQKEAEV
jgi:adenylate kinase